MVLVVQRQMMCVLVLAALLGRFFHRVSVLVLLDFGMRLGRMMGERRLAHQQNQQKHYDRAHGSFLLDSR